jgi:hypothetical protein
VTKYILSMMTSSTMAPMPLSHNNTPSNQQ